MKAPAINPAPSSARSKAPRINTNAVSFADWTGGRSISSWGTNTGATQLPFQNWQRVKEAFAPELVRRAIEESQIHVERCIDPFGGSGTTALACQFLGVHATTVEVNPYLADLIEAKLAVYNTDELARDLGHVLKQAVRARNNPDRPAYLPPSFIEPGVRGRWLFDQRAADGVARLRDAIAGLSSPSHRRLFRVLLGGLLISVSNVVVNGKGRRYRRGWQRIGTTQQSVIDRFAEKAENAITEAHRHARRACLSYVVDRGDCRSSSMDSWHSDVAIFSPPYPNSFDYSDVYNVELWMLGYLTDPAANRALRERTLSSHVQVSRDFSAAPSGSSTLDRILVGLESKREELWDHRIPDMVAAYFADIVAVLGRLSTCLPQGGNVWMVVGDSRYSTVQIETAKIIADLAADRSWTLSRIEPCRSMRSSPQQGGRAQLAETLLVLSKA